MQVKIETNEKSARRIMVSACLCGVSCRYDGDSSCRERFRILLEKDDCIPFCPEVLGGLTTPRPPAVISSGDGFSVLDGEAGVIYRDIDGDVSAEFIKGAEAALRLARIIQPPKIYLKERSPSCGVYNGKGTPGVTAASLIRNGFAVEPVE